MRYKYKLTYFDLTARAEIIRWIFAVAGVEFEDRRINYKEWIEMRKDHPTAQLPLLEFDGVKLVQSMAIARYLARKFGLVGNTPVDEAKADAIVDYVTDTITQITQVAMWQNTNSERAEGYKKRFLEEQFVRTVMKLEELATDSGHFVGDELSWADIAVVQLKDWFQMIGANVDFSNYPKLKKIHEEVSRNQRIAAWLTKRQNDADEKKRIYETKQMEREQRQREMESEERQKVVEELARKLEEIDVNVKLTDEDISRNSQIDAWLTKKQDDEDEEIRINETKQMEMEMEERQQVVEGLERKFEEIDINVKLTDEEIVKKEKPMGKGSTKM